MKWFALVCVLFVGCQTDTATVPREVEARAEQLSQILVESKGVAVKQDTAIQMLEVQSQSLNVQTQSLTTVAESLQDVASKVDALAAMMESAKPVSTVMTSQDAAETVAESPKENPVAEPQPYYSNDVYIENWSASYCGVCKTEKDILEALKNTTGLQYWTYMADDPKYLDNAKKLEIYDVPVLRFVRQGKQRKRLVGLRQASEIQAAIDEVRAMDLTYDESNVGSSDDLTIRLKLPVVETRWGLIDLEEFNCECPNQRCVELRAIKADYLDKPEFQNIGRKVEPGEQ